MSYMVKDWRKFQHFKNRRPPWIKLYREILERRDISVISDRCFRVLIMLWLLASESKEQDGTLPPIDDIAFRLRLPKDDVIKAILALNAFIDGDDIGVISERYQLVPPETERETETETETEREDRKGADDKPPKKLRVIIKAVDRLEQLKATYTPLGIDVDRELAKCRAWCIAKNKPEPTYMRLVNWMNNCDKTVAGGAPAKPTFQYRGIQEHIEPRIVNVSRPKPANQEGTP